MDSRDIYRARSAVSLLDDDHIRQFQTIPAIIFLIKQLFFIVIDEDDRVFSPGERLGVGIEKNV